jgi:hypothetical protein
LACLFWVVVKAVCSKPLNTRVTDLNSSSMDREQFGIDI